MPTFLRRCPLALALPLAAVVGVSACAPPPGALVEASAPMDLAMAPAPSDGGVRSDGAASPPCQQPASERPDGGVCLLDVRATVLDDQRAPVPNLLVSVCADQCYYGTTLVDGSVVVAVGAYVRPSTYSIVLHARPTWAGYYAPLPAVEPAPPPLPSGAPADARRVRFGQPLFVARLPATGPAIASDGSAQSLSSGEVTLEVPAGVSLSPSIEDALDGKAILFRTLRLPPALYPPFVDAAHPPAAVYAVTPYEADLVPGAGVARARIHVQNAVGLPAGAAVDVLGLGSLLWPAGPPPNVLAPIAAAHVSADGKTIDLDAGSSIDFVTWLALRPR